MLFGTQFLNSLKSDDSRDAKLPLGILTGGTNTWCGRHTNGPVNMLPYMAKGN